MQKLRVILADRSSAAAIALIAACLMMFQTIAGNAAEIARAGGGGGFVICSASLDGALEGGSPGQRSRQLCAECCAVCHLSHAVALTPSGRFVALAVRPMASQPVSWPSSRAPPRPAPRARSTLSRGPPILS
ncbi:DUF2946 family protein [Jiella mangrovi]|uniref:DUF2946 domain-containing protein n=1 Tax=Jiella mangrovi TaxID=2821407 RepID=A0ABS4BIF1_9HYPH|nr:DUF2946 family protein [Jiella mangrovi]MBP0616471.1 hypothetical protein [Jiella mangrovi]